MGIFAGRRQVTQSNDTWYGSITPFLKSASKYVNFHVLPEATNKIIYITQVNETTNESGYQFCISLNKRA